MMRFEEYAVALQPKTDSPMQSGNDRASFHRLIDEIQSAWPTLHSDDVEISHLMPPKTPEQEIICSKTAEGLFQVFLRLGSLQTSDISIRVAFAYANPRSVYKPMCALIEWLMIRYALSCYILPDLTPEQQQGIGSDINEAERLCDVLTPSMDYNRKFWQMDAQTEEEAILRPGQAVERFITPLYV